MGSPRNEKKEVKYDDKGKITSWDGTNSDGKTLKVLYDSGVLTTQSAKQVMKLYPQFEKYATRTLNSAIQGLKKSMKKEVEARKSRGSKVLKTKTNLLKPIGEDDSYNSAEDSDYEEDEETVVSELSDFSFDTVTTAFKSTHFLEKKKKAQECKKVASGGANNNKTTSDDGVPIDALAQLKLSEKTAGKKEKLYGNTAIGLPFVLDLWRDSLGRARISVQVHLLSGNDSYKKVYARISTDGRELVLTMPMSPYMSRSDFAFDTFLLSDKSLTDKDKYYVKLVLKHHPKVASRMVAIAKIKGRSTLDGFFYEQRIKLPRKVNHKFASKEDGDEMFHSKKFIMYPDGSIFLHCELVSETKDSYIPEERLLDASLMKTPAKKTARDPMDVEDTNEARVLSSEESVSLKQSASKRARTEGADDEGVNISGFDPTEEEGETNGDDYSDAGSALFKAQSPIFQAAAREKGEAALKMAAASSLAKAAAQGSAKASESNNGDGGPF